MRRRTLTGTAVALCLLLLAPACSLEKELTLEDAKAALQQSSYSAQVGALTAESVELTTNFTIGQGVQDAADNLHAFLKSQVACATITREGAKITTHFGVTGQGCLWNGKVWTGTVAVAVTKVEQGAIEIQHTWTQLSNGRATVSGTATVTWSKADLSRSSVSTWTAAVDDQPLSGGHQIKQRLLDPSLGLAAGIQIDGSRTWTGPAGKWALGIHGIQARGQDAVPQAGRYELDGGGHEPLTVTFSRKSETQIAVTIQGAKRSFTVLVNTLGKVEG